MDFSLKLLTFMYRYLFNDAEVKPFDQAQLAAECFGGEMTVKYHECFGLLDYLIKLVGRLYQVDYYIG